MGYLGSKPQNGFISNAKERYTGITTAYVDLNHSISSLADVIVWVNFVKQDATNLTLTSSTRITLGGTLVSADIVEVAYLGKAVATQNPSTNSVTNDMLVGSIANSKLANSSVSINGSSVSLGGSITGIGEDNKPIWDVKEGSATTVNQNTNTVIPYSTVVRDTASAFNTSTYKYVIPSNGYYFVRGSINIDWSDSGGDRADLTIRKGTETIMREMRVYASGGLAGKSNLEVSGIYLFSQNDAVFINLFKTGSGSKTTDPYQGYSQFQGFKVAST